jgi:Kelch motif
VNGKIYAIGGRLASAFVSLGSDTDVVEEYDPATDMWGFPEPECLPRALRWCRLFTVDGSTSWAEKSRAAK